MKTHVYTFTWSGKVGPIVKRFVCPTVAASYASEFSRLTGQPIQWATPFDLRGAL